MIRACIFDCDGTLVDTLESFVYCGNRALQDLGYASIPAVEYKKMVGDGAPTLLQRLLRRSGDLECRNYDRMAERYFPYFAADCMYGVTAYPGIREVLAEMKRRGVRMAVLSNKPHVQTEKVITDVFGFETFDQILGQKEGLAKKPAPDGAFLLRDQFGVTSEECLYVGDTNTDMKTGNAAGMQTVGVLWGFRDRQELEACHARYIIEKPEELLGLIKFL